MEKIEGVVEEIIFHNEGNGYTVLSLKAGAERTTCVGTLPTLAAGERLRVEGEWTEHPDYGRQLRIRSFESVQPTTRAGIERYLGSGLIKGVGAATAKLIVHAFGEETLAVLDEAPQRLTQIPGIGPKRAAMIIQSYQEQRQARQAMVFLQTYGLSPALSAKVVRLYGERTQSVVRADPYQLVEQVEGIGFKTADAIAFSLGIPRDSDHRLTCGIKYLLGEATRGGGHLFLPQEQLAEQAARLLEVPQALCQRAVSMLALSGGAVLRQVNGEDVVYDRYLYDAEREVAVRLCRLLGRARQDEGEDWPAQIRAYQRKAGLDLGEEQRQAVLTALKSPVSVITGGPGTGKTTCIRCMLALMRREGTVLLCAPTGRAAKRMQEASGEPAQTIHRLLEYSGESGSFLRGEDSPLLVDSLIVDEVSMVDITLMRSLLRALPSHARLVLVGDADQLPSVGAGNVLGDMIASRAVPVAHLTEIYRQAAQSDIVVSAHRINRGEMPVVNRKGGDFFFQRAATAAQAAQVVRELVLTRLPGFLGADPIRDIQVMCPMKKGEAGVWALGRMLQQALNPPGPDKRELTVGDALLREGDKVMQVRNHYELNWTRGEETGAGVFNGDMGFIQSIDPQGRKVLVAFDDERRVTYEESDLEDLETAYAMSVHKSQGSEFDAVVLPLVSGPQMLLTRNLLYTAVTRARRLVVLVGREECVRQMVNSGYVNRRYSNLAGALREVKGV